MKPIEIKILRIRAGLTQHEAGLIVGLPSYEVSRIETGRIPAESEKVHELCTALEARVDGEQ